MFPATRAILEALRKAKNKGISYHTYPPKALGSRSIPKRVCELLAMGYNIARPREWDGRCQYTRYILLGEPK